MCTVSLHCLSSSSYPAQLMPVLCPSPSACSATPEKDSLRHRMKKRKFFQKKTLKISSDKKKDMDCIKARRENKWRRALQTSGVWRHWRCSVGQERRQRMWHSDPEVTDLPREQLTTAMNSHSAEPWDSLGFPGFQVIAFPFCCPLKRVEWEGAPAVQ